MTTSKLVRWTAGLSLLGASAGQLAQFLVSPLRQSDSPADQVAAVAAHLSQMRLAILLDLPILLMIPAVLYLGLVAGAATSRLARAGTVLTFATVLGAGYLLAADIVVYAAAQQSDRPAATAVVSAFTGSGVFSGVAVFYLAGHVVGFALLGIAMYRDGGVPRWAAVALAVWPLFEMGGTAAGVTAIAAAGDALLLLACAAAFRALLRPAPEALRDRTVVGAAATL
jgi:hypothetical protein